MTSSDSTTEHATLADGVASAALSVPGVAELHPGAFGEVAAYLPGRKVAGVRLTDQVTEVHLVVDMGVPVLEVAEAVRTAVSGLVDTPVDVYVDDVDQAQLTGAPNGSASDGSDATTSAPLAPTA